MIVLEHVLLRSGHGDMPMVMVEVADSDDVCRAELDLLGEAPSFRSADQWRPITHLGAKLGTGKGWAHCRFTAIAPEPPRFEIRMPADGGCMDCDLF